MRWLLALMVMFVVTISSQAQESPVEFRLLMDSTELHTGQIYVVSLRIDASDVWAFSSRIDYDPTLLYVIGTTAGQPIKPAPILNNADGLTIFNRVQNDQLDFVYSRLAPAQSGSYSDTVATFQIYPLRAGTMTLKVSSAEANRISFKVDGGQRVIDTQSSLPVGANELTLTIIGDPVEPPLEVTATPMPHLIVTPDYAGVDVIAQATASIATPILLNDITPIAPFQSHEKPALHDTPLLVLALGLIAFALMGLLSLWMSSRRR